MHFLNLYTNQFYHAKNKSTTIGRTFLKNIFIYFHKNSQQAGEVVS